MPYVFVNGTLVKDNHQHTGALPGEVLVALVPLTNSRGVLLIHHREGDSIAPSPENEHQSLDTIFGPSSSSHFLSSWTNRPFPSARPAGSIVDGESGKPVTARIRLSQGTQPILPAGSLSMTGGENGISTCLLPSRFPLEPGEYTIRIERGKEFRPVEETFAVLAGQEVRRSFKLDRWINMESRGWYSADLHVHRPARGDG